MKTYKTLLVILISCLVSSAASADKKPKEILVFAGAGMRMPLNETGEAIKKLYGIKVIHDYEGTGRLGNKILAGQTPDVFIPGNEKWAKILKTKGYVEYYTPIAYHTPVIVTHAGNSKVNSLDDFADSSNQLVLGDIRACAIGGASAAILKKAGLEESRINIRARGITVKQLVLWVEGNNADASIVWKADAIQSGKVRIIGIPRQYNMTSIIPVCRMITYKKEAAEYIHYLLGIEGKAIFKKYGFDVVK